MKTIRVEGLMFGAAILMAPAIAMGQIPAAGSSAAQNQAVQVAGMNPTDLSTNASAGVDTRLMQDKIFVRRVAVGGFAEVSLGKLAVQKSSNDEVKKLGQTMVDDHMALENDLKPAADELGVRMPTKLSKEDQDEFDKLSALSGTDFDKEYLAYTLRAHRKDLHEFRAEVASTIDSQIKDAMPGMEIMIAGHLYLVNRVALANGVPSAYKPGMPMPASPRK